MASHAAFGPGNTEFYQSPLATYVITSLSFKPEDGWDIDTKLDDGKPATGRLTTFKDSSAFGPNCSNGDTITAQYDFTVTADNCRLIYQMN